MSPLVLGAWLRCTLCFWVGLALWLPVVPLWWRTVWSLLLGGCAGAWAGFGLFGAVPQPTASHGLAGVWPGELWLAMALGAAMGAPVLGWQWAGQLLDRLGWPEREGGPGPLSRLFSLLAPTLFAAVGGLRALVEVLWHSLQTYPPGAFRPPPGQAALLPLLRLWNDAVHWALYLAAPCVLAQLLAAFASALLTRFAGALGAGDGRALRGPLLLGVLALSLSGMVDILLRNGDQTLRRVHQLLQAF